MLSLIKENGFSGIFQGGPAKNTHLNNWLRRQLVKREFTPKIRIQSNEISTSKLSQATSNLEVR